MKLASYLSIRAFFPQTLQREITWKGKYFYCSFAHYMLYLCKSNKSAQYDEVLQRYWGSKIAQSWWIVHNIACIYDERWLTLLTFNNLCEFYQKTFSRDFIEIVKVPCVCAITFKTPCRIKWASESRIV